MSRTKSSTDHLQGDTDPAGHLSCPAAIRTERARLAGITAHHGSNSDQARTARRDYRAVALAEHIRRVNEAAPPLTAAQRDKLAGLLRSSAPEHAAEIL
jgi:hypothetical protein